MGGLLWFQIDFPNHRRNIAFVKGDSLGLDLNFDHNLVLLH